MDLRLNCTGWANVSVVDTGANKVVGEPLKVWASGYAASTNLPADQAKFSVKVPELAGKCEKAGACVSVFRVLRCVWVVRVLTDVAA